MRDGAHILFVDDEESIRLTLSALLESHGFKVTCAATVQDALTLVANSRFDVLLADLNVGQPGDGFTVVSAMRRTHPQAVTLILTGYPDFESALQAIRQQVDDFLTKPTDISVLVETIKSKLANRTTETLVRTRRLPEVIRQEQKAVTEDWLVAVKNDTELSLIPISDSERVDHLPTLLDAALHVSAGNQITAKASKAATLHGNVRLQQGYTVPLMMRESRLLISAVVRCVQKNLLVIDISTLIPDLMNTCEVLGALAEVSVRSFLAGAR